MALVRERWWRRPRASRSPNARNERVSASYAGAIHGVSDVARTMTRLELLVVSAVLVGIASTTLAYVSGADAVAAPVAVVGHLDRGPLLPLVEEAAPPAVTDFTALAAGGGAPCGAPAAEAVLEPARIVTQGGVRVRARATAPRESTGAPAAAPQASTRESEAVRVVRIKRVTTSAREAAISSASSTADEVAPPAAFEVLEVQETFAAPPAAPPSVPMLLPRRR